MFRIELNDCKLKQNMDLIQWHLDCPTFLGDKVEDDWWVHFTSSLNLDGSPNLTKIRIHQDEWELYDYNKIRVGDEVELVDRVEAEIFLEDSRVIVEAIQPNYCYKLVGKSADNEREIHYVRRHEIEKKRFRAGDLVGVHTDTEYWEKKKYELVLLGNIMVVSKEFPIFSDLLDEPDKKTLLTVDFTEEVYEIRFEGYGSDWVTGSEIYRKRGF